LNQQLRSVRDLYADCDVSGAEEQVCPEDSSGILSNRDLAIAGFIVLIIIGLLMYRISKLRGVLNEVRRHKQQANREF